MSEAACPRAGKWIRGCRFEARFDIGPGVVSDRAVAEAWPSDLPNLHRAAKPSTYVRDICVTCGRSVEREIFIEALDPTEMPDEA